MSKKASLSLSVNAIVVIILSLVILSSGIVLLQKFITSSDEIKDTVDARQQEEIERLIIDQNKQVALPLSTVKIERGEGAGVGLGILNIFKESQRFRVEITQGPAYDTENNEMDSASSLSWVKWDRSVLEIDEGEHTTKTIVVAPPKDITPGKYVFTVKVKTDAGELYGTVQKVWVIVQ